MSRPDPLEFDTEFNSSNQEFQNVVCAVIKVGEEIHKYWLLDDADRLRFHADWDLWMSEGRSIISYNVTAETRSLLALGYTFHQIILWSWIDPYIWWKMLVQSHPSYRWGTKFVTLNGKRVKIISTPPPDGELEEDTFITDDDGNLIFRKAKDSHKAQNAKLATAVAHIFGVDLNEDYKDTMVKMILETENFTPAQRVSILDYCAEDVKYLRPLTKALLAIVRRETEDNVGLNYLKRLSLYSVCNAQVENNGIPLDLKKAHTLSGNIPFVEDALISKCVSKYPFYAKENLTAKDRRDGKVGTTKWVEKKVAFAEYIRSLGLEEIWPRTERGNLKADVDTLEDFGGDDNLGTLRTCKKSRNNLRFFGPDKWKRMLKNLGTDGRIRPGLRPFGTITSRHTAQTSKGYIFGMSTWLRTLIGKSGIEVISGDYSFEEMVIQAWASHCDNLMQACQSGDPYMWLAQYCGAINTSYGKTGGGFVDGNGDLLTPDERKAVKVIRDTYKSLMLGLGYGMGDNSLAIRLTQNRLTTLLTKDEQALLCRARMDTNADLQAEASVLMGRVTIYPKGNQYPADQRATTYSNHHRESFREYWVWRDEYLREFRGRGWACTLDGWCLFSWATDQTAKNFYIQGTGQTILRRAVLRCLLKGLRVCSPLHDAIYLESTPEKAEEDKTLLVEEMVQAGTDIMGECLLKVDPKVMHTDWTRGVSTWTEDKQGDEFKSLMKYMLS